MSPFGSIGFSLKTPSPLAKADEENPLRDGTARLWFEPKHQVLHTASSFSLLIDDPSGVPDEFELQLFYNGFDVAPGVLARADRLFVDGTAHHRLRLTLKNIRILASRENRIRAIYRRSPDAIAITKAFQAPRCSAFRNDTVITAVPDFKISAEVISTINASSQKYKLNPYYVAALIAQESGFDPLALSPRRALGLTQVTAQGEAEVVKKFTNWPRYPGLEEMSLLSLKGRILTGQLNGSNEWRLNPVHSIEGGVEYVSYLLQYWNREDKRSQVELIKLDDPNALSNLVLGSYNAGGARVSQAVERQGSKWLQDKSLSTTKQYVRRVASYCNYFEEERP